MEKGLVRDWKSVLNADPVDWLLEHENPSVRYFTLKDIVDLSDQDLEVEETKNAIRCYEKVTKIFSKQKSGGYWESAEQPYMPKYKSTYWQIMILSQLGLDRNDERVRKACEFIFQFQLEEGGFSAFGEEGARIEYLWMKKKKLKTRKRTSTI